MSTGDSDGERLPFPDSLCHRCRHMRTSGNRRGSVFLQCTEPSLPKYLPQPVRRCHAFAPAPQTPPIPESPP